MPDNINKTGGGGVRRLIFTGNVKTTLFNKYTPGSGVGALNRSVRRALVRKASVPNCKGFCSDVNGTLTWSNMGRYAYYKQFVPPALVPWAKFTSTGAGTATGTGGWLLARWLVGGNIVVTASGKIEYLIIGGGGGGGGSRGAEAYAGGGSGGDVVEGSVILQAGTYLLTIGAGGAGGVSPGTPGANGTASDLKGPNGTLDVSIIAEKGNGAINAPANEATTGAASAAGAGGSGVVENGGGGGGGAGGAGQDAAADPAQTGGTGGVGTNTTFLAPFGNPVINGGAGGGGGGRVTGGQGGSSSTGNGGADDDDGDNGGGIIAGAGGGGSASKTAVDKNGGNGQQGIIYIRYKN